MRTPATSTTLARGFSGSSIFTAFWQPASGRRLKARGSRAERCLRCEAAACVHAGWAMTDEFISMVGLCRRSLRRRGQQHELGCWQQQLAVRLPAYGISWHMTCKLTCGFACTGNCVTHGGAESLVANFAHELLINCCSLRVYHYIMQGAMLGPFHASDWIRRLSLCRFP